MQLNANRYRAFAGESLAERLLRVFEYVFLHLVEVVLVEEGLYRLLFSNETEEK